jgi:hypothetical protein
MGAIGSLQAVEPGPGEQKARWLDSWPKPTLCPARCSKHLWGRPRRNVWIKRFLRATLVSSYFEDTAYERMQAEEMARAQAVWRKKRRENFGHRPLTSSPLFSLVLTAEI